MDSTVNSQSNTVAPKQAECKKMRYSIRKVAAVGATSALVGTLAFLGATQVKADQVTETAPAVATATATPETSTASLTVAATLFSNQIQVTKTTKAKNKFTNGQTMEEMTPLTLSHSSILSIINTFITLLHGQMVLLVS